MSILLDNTTRVIVQGITGREGQFHTRNMIAAGTNLVGGVTPGKGGTTIEGLPVFDTVEEAINATGATATCIFVPPAGAADAIMEAASAGIELIVCITEGIPVIDMTRAMLVVHELPRHVYTGSW
jgi:succinyl-CoA synthetase alpha subunit